MGFYRNKNLFGSGKNRSGVALIFTVIVLVLLTALVYRLSDAVSQWKHRMQYMIDYQAARYSCESGLKYALASMTDVNAACISRPNEPDFSDLFTMSDADYKQMLLNWAQELAMQVDANGLSKSSYYAQVLNMSTSDSNDSNSSSSYNYDTNDANYTATSSWDSNDPNTFYVRGPYGPPWPYVVNPIEIELDNSKITIEIIDENAKLPLVWGMCTDANTKDESKAAVTTFCEWMQMNSSEIESLDKELDAMKEVKPFSINLKSTSTTTKDANDSNSTTSGRTSRRASRTRRTSRAKAKAAAQQQERSEFGDTLDFAKILHSPMLDIETLAKPVNESETRTESALKYISLWGTQKVNINSAPRQVLEAAFTFGGDAAEIAQQIIDERKIKPFTSIEDLKKRLISYSASIVKSESYIMTQSDCYSIRVRATSGVARVCATAAVKKEKDKVKQIGIIIE